MKKTNIIVTGMIVMLLQILTFIRLNAQETELYMPRNIKKLYEKGTRSYDGKPGTKYWQNHSDYRIKAEVLPDSSTVEGSEKIVYFNESPDTLKRIVIRLYQDILRKGGVVDLFIGDAELTDGVRIKNLSVNGSPISLDPGKRDVNRNGTNMTVRLKTPLPPKSSITVECDWSVYIPKILKIRMGNYANGEMFIAYWYPQMAVYDDIDGWDMLNYSGIVEFYNDFSNFDFEITLPAKYAVWATGELQNPGDVFQPAVIDRMENAKKSDKTVRIISAEDFKKGLVTKNDTKNTWKFKASNVTDISFCLSDSYIWDAASVQVDNSGRRVLTSALYEDSTRFYEEAAEFSRATIEYLSKGKPGYPYPYPHVTSFCNKEAGGGMETPMMANDGMARDRGDCAELIFHEISHTLLPFFMGTNERKYAWMDEGWATFLPAVVADSYNKEGNYTQKTIMQYENTAGNENELPLITPSFSNKGNFVLAFYSKPAACYFELEQLLGPELFKKALLEYMNRWHEKHPMPYDFFNTFNDVAGEDLTWFWRPWFFEFGYPDLSLKEVKTDNKEINITVEKLGVVPTRVELNLTFTDGTKETIKKSAREWKNKSLLTISVKSDKPLKEVTLGSPLIPDSERKNNNYSNEKVSMK